MRCQLTSGSSRRRVTYLMMMVFMASVFCGVMFARSDSDSNPDSKVIARGAGTTIIQGGTGAPSFTPVLTTIAFHAERQGGAVTGGFECLALSPEASTGPGSAKLTVNVMYGRWPFIQEVVKGYSAT